MPFAASAVVTSQRTRFDTGSDQVGDLTVAVLPRSFSRNLPKSTPNYAFQFDDLGFHDTGPVLTGLMRAGELQGMAATVTDEMLDAFALVARWDDMADALIARYAGVAERVVPYLALDDIQRAPSALGQWGEIARAVRAG